MGKEDESLPENIPVVQTEILPDGKTVTRNINPVNYGLLVWIKRWMNLEDSLDISEDEQSGMSTHTLPYEGRRFCCGSRSQ